MSGGKIPWKVRFLIAVHKFTVKISCHSDQTVNRPLLNFFDPKKGPTTSPRKGVSTSDTIVDASRNLWFRLFSPTIAAGGGGDNEDVSMPVIFYFHGGGFAFFTASSFVYDDFCRRMATVVSVNYRLSPEHKYPCQYEDGFDALRFIDANFDELNFPPGADPNRCLVAGDSAGGNLAHHVAVKAAGQNDQLKRLKINGLLAIQPFFGGEERTESEIRFGGSSSALTLERTDWFWKAYLPDGSDRDHPAANVFGSKAVGDISGVDFPATLLVVGGMDPLQDWQRKYCEWLKEAGKQVDLVEYPNMFHGFYAFADFPESSLFIKETKDFIQKQTKSAGGSIN